MRSNDCSDLSDFSTFSQGTHSTPRRRRSRNLIASLVALLLAATLSAQQPDGADGADGADEAGGATAATPFDEANLYFELNHTDGDLGLHGLIDGDAWRLLTIKGPGGGERLRVTASGTLRKQGMTELFFESAEPPFDEVPPATFFARFPEGTWRLEGQSIEGEKLSSTDVLRQVLAAPAGNIRISGVPAAENCDAPNLPSVSNPVIIDWDPVTTSHPTVGKAGAVTIVAYQLFVEHGGPTPVKLSLDLPPTVTRFEIPEEFIDLHDEWKFEIVAREATGNQTAIESCFEID